MNAKTPGTSWSISFPAQASNLADDSEHGLIAKKVGKWGDPDFPTRDWICVGDEDLGEATETCQMCEYKQIRYVQTMHHPATGLTLRTGRVCAGHLGGDLDAALSRDKAIRNAGRQVAIASKALKRDQLSLLGKPGLEQLEALRRDAWKRANKIETIDGKFPCLYFFDQSYLHYGHARELDAAVESARATDPKTLLQTAIDHPVWKGTKFGSSLSLPEGCAVRVYDERRGYVFELTLKAAGCPIRSIAPWRMPSERVCRHCYQLFARRAASQFGERGNFQLLRLPTRHFNGSSLRRGRYVGGRAAIAGAVQDIYFHTDVGSPGIWEYLLIPCGLMPHGMYTDQAGLIAGF